MDPFIEMQEWSDFHATYMTVIRELLAPQVRPRYVVRVERREYLEEPFDEPDQIIPDMAILERWGSSRSSAGTAVLAEPAAAMAPVECLLPEAEEHHEYFLVLRDRETMRIVTRIELLSPTNKRAGSEGREQYLEKREEILQSRTNLVELDLQAAFDLTYDRAAYQDSLDYSQALQPPAGAEDADWLTALLAAQLGAAE